MEFLADFLWDSTPRVRVGLLHNVSHAMSATVTDPAVVRTARQAYRHLWLNYLDLFRAPTLSPEELAAAVTIEGEATLSQVLNGAGRGIIVAGHFAGAELAFQAMAARGWTACLPAERMQPEAFFRWLCDLRSRHGHRIIASDTLLKPLVHTLRTGGLVGLALDRDTTQSGVPVHLCDAMVRLPASATKLSRRYAAPVVPVTSQRQANGQVTVTVGEPLAGEAAVSSRSLALGVEALAGTLERMITAAPDQWVLTTPLWDLSIDD